MFLLVCYIKREGSYINLFCFMVLRKTNFYIWPSNYALAAIRPANCHGGQCVTSREKVVTYINLFCFMVLRKTNFYIWPSNYHNHQIFLLVIVNLKNMIKSGKNLNFVCLFNVWNWIINQKSAETIPIIHSLVCGTCKWFLDNGSWTIFKQLNPPE